MMVHRNVILSTLSRYYNKKEGSNTLFSFFNTKMHNQFLVGNNLMKEHFN